MVASVVTEQDVARLRELLAAQVTAMRERDAEALVAQFTADAVTFTLAPPLWNPTPVVRDVVALRAWMDTFDGPIGYENREMDVEVSGDLAFGYGVSRLSATPKGMTEGFELWFRSTWCWRRVAGEWLLAHEHRSTPFYMDGSMRASLDLQP